MVSKLSLLSLILLCSIAPVAASQTDSQQLSRAQEIWEEAIRAKGGREKLEAVRNIFISSIADRYRQTRSTIDPKVDVVFSDETRYIVGQESMVFA
jgi:hypothetical protein